MIIGAGARSGPPPVFGVIMSIVKFKSKDQLRYEELSKKYSRAAKRLDAMEAELEELTIRLLKASLNLGEQKNAKTVTDISAK